MQLRKMVPIPSGNSCKKAAHCQENKILYVKEEPQALHSGK